MDAARRLTDSEVTAVLRRAAEDADQRGLTAAQVQEIGSEVGLSSDAVRRALAESASGSLRPSALKRSLGIPVGVAKEVVLPGTLSDAGWDVLVSVARATFNAHGKESRTGVVREWRNGRLRIASEPTPAGIRIRMSTEKEGALAAPFIGSVAAFVNAGALVIAASTRPALMMMAAIPAAFGAALLVAPLVRLPRWARTRSEQFDALAREAASLVTPADSTALPRDSEP